MKALVLALLVFAGAARAADPASSGFQIDHISPSKEWLWVDEAWKEGADCIPAKLSVTKDFATKVYPKDDMKKFEFEEKASISASAQQ